MVSTDAVHRWYKPKLIETFLTGIVSDSPQAEAFKSTNANACSLAMAAQAEPEYRRPWSLKSFPIPVDSQASYIGFEIESSCTDIGFIPHDQRERKIVRHSVRSCVPLESTR